MTPHLAYVIAGTAAGIILLLAGFRGGQLWERAGREADELADLDSEDQADDDYADTLAAIPSVPSHDGNPREPEPPITLQDVYRFHPALEIHEPDPIDREWGEDGWTQLGDRTWMPPAEVLAGRPPGDALSDLLWRAALMKVS